MCSCVRTLLCLLSFTALTYTAPALAQSQDEFGEEEDPFDFEDLSDAGDTPAPTPQPDSPIEEKDDLEDEVDPEESETDDYLDDTESDDDAFSLLDDEEEINVLAPGVDTEALFRAQRNRSEDLTVDEAIGSWEGYLARYPNTLFRKQISEIIDALMETLYGQGIIGGGGCRCCRCRRRSRGRRRHLFRRFRPRGGRVASRGRPGTHASTRKPMASHEEAMRYRSHARSFL